ncbi:MAG: GHMP kinase [Flavobacteriaceae bacterium]|nr:GHMP kinase [Flavobacteriaceae bacterium]
MSQSNTLSYRASGKLLITGEYVVLDGATALALPTRLGQRLEVTPTAKAGCSWKSFDHNGLTWFEVLFSKNGDILSHSKDGKVTASTLKQILTVAQKLNPDFDPFNGNHIETHLEFPNNWGLGSSSTLLYSIAQWAKIDAYQLLSQSFGGSGYDVAVPAYNNPILYTLEEDEPKVKSQQLPWLFKEQLYFVHLNQKMSSKDGIAHYKKMKLTGEIPVEKITQLTHRIAAETSLENVIPLFEEHESILSEFLQLPTIKQRLFPEYPGLIKSLGAWGGDFIMVSGDDASLSYFKEKGYTTILPYSDMIA